MKQFLDMNILKEMIHKLKETQNPKILKNVEWCQKVKSHYIII